MYDKVSEYLKTATQDELIEVFEVMTLIELERVKNLIDAIIIHNIKDTNFYIQEKSEYQDAKEVDDLRRHREAKYDF